MLDELTPVTADDRQYHALGQIFYHSSLGSQQQAAVVAREWMAYERDRGDAYSIARSARVVGNTAAMTGDFVGAREALSEALRIARESRLWLQLFIAHDQMIAIAEDYEPTGIFRQTLESAWLECEPLLSRVPHVEEGFSMHRAVLALEEGNAAEALRHLPARTHPAFNLMRTIHLAVQLGARMLNDTRRVAGAEIQALADELAPSFARPCEQLGWSGAVYAEFLERYHGSEAADAFVRKLLLVLRELVPPRRLAPFVARIRQSPDVASPEPEQPLLAY
jgi:hypothetical protein